MRGTTLRGFFRRRTLLTVAGALATFGLILLAIAHIHIGRDTLAVCFTILGPATAATLLVGACAVVKPPIVPQPVEAEIGEE